MNLSEYEDILYGVLFLNHDPSSTMHNLEWMCIFLLSMFRCQEWKNLTLIANMAKAYVL